MRCAGCQHENPAHAKFCLQCGARLALRCAQCGTELPAGARFCLECGQRVASSGAPAATSADTVPTAPKPVAAVSDAGQRLRTYTPRHLSEKILKARSALEGERRQVTILFADIAGYTSLAEQLDPEEVHQLIDRCFELITAEVHRFEGTINQYTGDGVMALFGAPIAHEDAARRAVHAALAIQRAMRDHGKDVQERLGRPLQMRIGLNTGVVVVGRIGDDLRMDYTAVGDTTNLAARMQQIARPGSVLVSDATHRIVSGFFDTLDLGEVSVKGHAPVRAFEVLRARGRRARLDVAVERGLTPLVGRDRELATLRDLFQQVKSGRGQVVSLVGEAGIGKSRLLLEFRRALAQAGEDATWIEGRCVSFGQSIPFLPLIDQLRENFRIEELDGEPEIIAKVEHGMRRMGELEPHIPYIRYLLSVDPGDPAILAMDAGARRKKLFDAARALAIRGAALRPLVLVFEDLHWIDTSSEEHLTTLVNSATGVPLMLILTYRVGYAPRFGGRSFHTALTLASLSERDAIAMAGRVLGTEQFPQELKAALMEKAEGVPLFVEEVTKTLLDLGILRLENDRYRMVRGLGEVSVPDTIQGIIMARLDRLGEDGKRTVQLASVIGRQFLHRLLEKIAGLTGELEGLLQELKALEIIYEQGLLPEPAYIFKHAVIQDVAYNSLLVQRRKELHRAVGHAIEDLYADRLAEHYAELAHHFFQAEEWRRAIDYSVHAGQRASASFANTEAKAHYARAVAAAGKLGPALDPATQASLHESHGGVLTVLGEYETAAAEYERALELVRGIGDRHREIDVLVALSSLNVFFHRPAPAIAFVDRAIALVQDGDDPGIKASCASQRALIRGAGFGEPVEAMPDVDEALRLSERVENPQRLAQVLIWPATILQWRGEFERALRYLHQAAEIALKEHAGFMFGAAAFVIGNAYTARGEYEEALRWYRRLEDYAAAAGDKFFMARAPNVIGGIHLDVFDLDDAISRCVEGDEIAQKFFPWPEPRGHSLLKAGLAHLRRGEHGLAEEFFGRAWALLDLDVWLRWRWHIPLLHARGEMALIEGRHEDAWRFATESLEMATRSDAQKHVARAERLQGEVLAASGQLEQAIPTFATALSRAERLGTPREVWMTRAALGGVLARLGRDREAEANLLQSAETIEAIASKLTTPALHRAFVTSQPVAKIFQALGRPEPAPG